jgi:hypothetical protein
LAQPDLEPQAPAPSRLRQNSTIASHQIQAFMLTYNTHLAHPFEWKKGVSFYQRLKDRIARSDLQLAA